MNDSNTNPPEYQDPLELALVEQEIGKIRHEPFATISPDTSIHEAIEKLAGLHIACLMVAENDALVGVLSDRDVLKKVALEFDEIKDQTVRDVMTADPIFVYETDSSVNALSVMALCGYRHVPVVDLNDNLVGIISQAICS